MIEAAALGTEAVLQIVILSNGEINVRSCLTPHDTLLAVLNIAMVSVEKMKQNQGPIKLV